MVALPSTGIHENFTRLALTNLSWPQNNKRHECVKGTCREGRKEVDRSEIERKKKVGRKNNQNALYTHMKVSEYKLSKLKLNIK